MDVVCLNEKLKNYSKLVVSLFSQGKQILCTTYFSVMSLTIFFWQFCRVACHRQSLSFFLQIITKKRSLFCLERKLYLLSNLVPSGPFVTFRRNISSAQIIFQVAAQQRNSNPVFIPWWAELSLLVFCNLAAFSEGSEFNVLPKPSRVFILPRPWWDSLHKALPQIDDSNQVGKMVLYYPWASKSHTYRELQAFLWSFLSRLLHRCPNRLRCPWWAFLASCGRFSSPARDTKVPLAAKSGGSGFESRILLFH